jgi:ATP-dependent Clp protease ATP-binding subunit ClpA
MYEQFTDRARKVMQLANQEAQRFNHEYIGTEHILLGLVKEGSGVGAEVLKRLGIDLRKVRLEVEKITVSGQGPFPTDKLPSTPRAKKVIEFAINKARGLNHNHVGTEHLLLGLLDEKEGVAAQVLFSLGVSVDRVRREVLQLPSNPPEGKGEDPGPAMPHFQLAGKTDYNRLTEQVRRMIRVANEEGTRIDPAAVLSRLPEDVKQTLTDIATEINWLARQREQAVAEQDFERAALLRQQVDEIKKILREGRGPAPPRSQEDA